MSLAQRSLHLMGVSHPLNGMFTLFIIELCFPQKVEDLSRGGGVNNCWKRIWKLKSNYNNYDSVVDNVVVVVDGGGSSGSDRYNDAWPC